MLYIALVSGTFLSSHILKKQEKMNNLKTNQDSNKKPRYWLPCLSLYICLLLAVSLFATEKGYGVPNAKYIILMISDGQGAKNIEATNTYLGNTPSFQVDPAWTQLWVSTFPYGGSYDTTQAWTNFNYVKNGWTDSAAAASALYTGVKTANGRVAVTHDAEDRLFSIGELAKILDKAVGAVTTTSVSDATPGAWTSHNDSRINGYAIADEAFFGNPNTTGLPSNLLYGGGHEQSLPSVDVLIGGRSIDYVSSAILDKLRVESGQPGKHLLVERQAGQDGGSIFLNAAINSDTTKLVGLFDHVFHNADDSGFDPENPTLADSTNAALIVLNRNPSGFVLMVEGGAIDWGAHANDMNHMIGEQIDFYNAVQAVISWVEDPTNDSSWANTLVIITADHDTGYLTAGVGIFPDVPLGNVNDTTLSLEKIYNGSGGRRASWIDSDNNGYIDATETVYWVWNSNTHINTLVPLSARGPGADLFADFIAGNDTVRGNYIDNTDVYTVMDMVIGGSDGCPDDPGKLEPGICGCGVADSDSDGNGLLDCEESDECPDDAFKTKPGICGCGVADTDLDGDGTIDRQDTDDDNDGVHDWEEQGPDGNDQNYDGNHDVISDSLQNNVISLNTYDDQNYITLESPAGTSFSNCIVVDNSSSSNALIDREFSYGLFDFRLNGVNNGSSTIITLHLSAGTTIDAYYKYGPTPNNPTKHWYNFLFDGHTGAEIGGDVITLHLVDGMRGDDDLTANGIIFEFGGPVMAANSVQGTNETVISSDDSCFVGTLRHYHSGD